MLIKERCYFVQVSSTYISQLAGLEGQVCFEALIVGRRERHSQKKSPRRGTSFTYVARMLTSFSNGSRVLRVSCLYRCLSPKKKSGRENVVCRYPLLLVCRCKIMNGSSLRVCNNAVALRTRSAHTVTPHQDTENFLG